jgi:regulator of protease activity HflC (stomatin/prohibitin superfamily)
MDIFVLIALLPLLFAILLTARSLKVVRTDHRGLVFRLGRFSHVLRPGLHVVFPFLDRVQDVNLPSEMAGWQGLSERELEQRLKERGWRMATGGLVGDDSHRAGR